MKRQAFTMIELIFVIVILGILAAVAIPKLAATRDDANVARAAMEVARAVHDIGSYYTSQGSFNYDSTLMTNVHLSQDGGNTGVIAADETEIWHYSTRDENCVDLNVTGDGNISVINGASTAKICTMLEAAITELKASSPHVYGGNTVNFD